MDPYENLFDSNHDGSLSNSERGYMEDFMVHEHNMINNSSDSSQNNFSDFHYPKNKADKRTEKRRIAIFGICIFLFFIGIVFYYCNIMPDLSEIVAALSFVVGIIYFVLLFR